MKNVEIWKCENEKSKSLCLDPEPRTLKLKLYDFKIAF